MQPQSLTGLTDRLVSESSGDQVTLGELLDSFDSRSYGPLLLVPALLAASPVGAIPGMSVLTGTLIILLAIQMLIGRSTPWLPSWLTEWSFERVKLSAAHERLRPWLKSIDRPLHQRLEFLVKGAGERVAALLCIGLAGSFYPLSLLPFAVAIPATAVCALALAICVKDGALLLGAEILSVLALGAAVYWVAC